MPKERRIRGFESDLEFRRLFGSVWCGLFLSIF